MHSQQDGARSFFEIELLSLSKTVSIIHHAR